MTNLEKMRQASAEELAKFLTKYHCRFCDSNKTNGCRSFKNCCQAMRNLLNSEVEE